MPENSILNVGIPLGDHESIKDLWQMIHAIAIAPNVLDILTQHFLYLHNRYTATENEELQKALGNLNDLCEMYEVELDV